MKRLNKFVGKQVKIQIVGYCVGGDHKSIYITIVYTSAADGNVAKGCDRIAIINQQLRREIIIIMEVEVTGVRTSKQTDVVKLDQ